MRRRPPAGADKRVWRDGQRNARERYEGPTTDEPYVRERLQALRGALARQYRDDAVVRPARDAARNAERAIASATERRALVRTETEAAIREMSPAASGTDIDAIARRAEARRARALRKEADREVVAARDTLTAAQHELPDAEAAAVDRLVGPATRGLEPVNGYVAAFNDERTYEGRPGIEPLPVDFAFVLIQEAVRQIIIERRG